MPRAPRLPGDPARPKPAPCPHTDIRLSQEGTGVQSWTSWAADRAAQQQLEIDRLAYQQAQEMGKRGAPKAWNDSMADGASDHGDGGTDHSFGKGSGPNHTWRFNNSGVRKPHRPVNHPTNT